MPASSGIELYKTALAAQEAAERQAAELNVAALAENARKLREHIKAGLVPNWPYSWDDGHILVRRKNWLNDRLELMPAHGNLIMMHDTGPPPVPPPLVAPVKTTESTLWTGFLALLRFALAVAVATFFVSGEYKHIHWPELHNPFVTAPAVKAGQAEAKDLLDKIGASFQTAASDIKAGKGISAAKAAHVARLPGIVQLAPGSAFEKLLDAVVPPGSDETKITPAQTAAYGQVIDEFAQGILSKAK